MHQGHADPVFDAYVIREQNGIPLAIIAQAFPYPPDANGAQFTPDWAFGIDEARLQAVVNEVRNKGAHVVVMLSHNGMAIDLKLAARISGIDMILGGHPHDGVPLAQRGLKTQGSRNNYLRCRIDEPFIRLRRLKQTPP